MWWSLQITGCLAIVATLTYSRIAGLCPTTYAVYVAVQAVFIAWAFPVSYSKAPSFLQAWFLGNAVLALGGFAVSTLFLKEIANIHNYVGAVAVIIGSILLII
jgi:hypothetical protein